jgi:signal transduction histidine kinase
MITRPLNKLTLLTSDYKWLLVLMLTGLYIGVFQIFYSTYGDRLAFLSCIPVLAAAWLFGLKGGLVAVILAIPGQVLLFNAQGADGLNIILHVNRLFDVLLMLITTLAVGLLSDRSRADQQGTSRLASSDAAVSQAEYLNLNAQQKLEAALQKERELLQLKNRLMVTISHEFRTPLSVILASTELLDRYFERLSPTRRIECLSTIKTQVVHLREMLNDITVITGGEDFTLTFRPSPLNLEALFQTVVAETQASVGSAYQITLTLEGNLNPVSADEELVRTILHNLLNNAVKYSPTGSTVYVHVSRRADEMSFSVKDNGIGIPSSEESRIFDTFHRASNVSHIGGLGLGLKIVRDFVNLHGGTVQVDSEEGKGTTFTVHLPIPASGNT